jgi:hypothetical protein
MTRSQSAFIQGACVAVHDLDAVGREDRVEGVGVLRIPIADQEAQRVDSYAQLGGEIAGLPHLRGLDVSGLRQGSVKSMATVTTRDTVLPTIRGH